MAAAKGPAGRVLIISRLAGAVVAVLALVAVAAPVAGASRSAHTTATMGSFNHNGVVHVLRHPRRFRVDSSDSYIVFFKLHWRHWGARRSVAHGRVRTCDYSGGCESSAVRVTASRRARCQDDYSYNRMTASHVPLYGNGALRLPVEKSGCVRERRGG